MSIFVNHVYNQKLASRHHDKWGSGYYLMLSLQWCNSRDPSDLHRGDRGVDENVQWRVSQRQLPEICRLDHARQGEVDYFPTVWLTQEWSLCWSLMVKPHCFSALFNSKAKCGWNASQLCRASTTTESSMPSWSSLPAASRWEPSVVYFIPNA